MKYIQVKLCLAIVLFFTINQIHAKEFDHEIVPSKTSVLFNLGCDKNIHYKVSYKKFGSPLWQHLPIDYLNVSSGSINKRCPHHLFRIRIPNLQCGTHYQIRALRLHNGPKDKVYSTNTLQCSGGSVSTSVVRLKHMNTGKCAYGFKRQNTWQAFNWGCWPDPNMAFEKIDIDSNKFKLKHRNSGLCLLTQSVNGGHAELNNCSFNWGAMIFTKEPTTNGKFRLKSLVNQCLYGNPNNGGQVSSWGCWNDPNMEFVFEYY